MDDDWGGGGPPGGGLSSKKKDAAGEVDYKSKSGTAWSHNYLNQKPWHPLSYPNQRRKWIAEQMHAQKERRADEIAREFAQEQEFFRQTALASKKEKEKMEMMKAVSFMYVRPPGYNAESAKAAEVADESKKEEQLTGTTNQQSESAVAPTMPEAGPSRLDKKKDRPKDVFGRALPSAEDFEVLKNAPRLETGAPVRIKPFAVEVRNVRCVRCGTHGHQSGDRECPLKDVIMPNDESRLMRDDPLRVMTTHADPSEPVKWELKQRPGMSPPHGGFQPDDPNQQIVPEDIFDEYGGFLGGGGIPSELLININARKSRKNSSRKRKHSRYSLDSERRMKGNHDRRSSSSESDTESEPRKSRNRNSKKKKQHHEYNETATPSESRLRDRRDRRSSSSDTDRGLEPKCVQGRNAKKNSRHRERHYTSMTSSEEHHTGTKLEPRKSKSRHAKEKRQRYEDSETSSASGTDSDREVEHGNYKTKHVKKNGRHDHGCKTSSSRRRRVAKTSTPSMSDSSDSRVHVRKLKSKHRHKASGHRHFVSDRNDREEESRRKSKRRVDDTSSTSSDGHHDRHSPKRKHSRR